MRSVVEHPLVRPGAAAGRRALDTGDGLLRVWGREVERLTGVPAFASLGVLIAIVSLLPGLFVLYTDIAVHIDSGRDTTLLTPSHGIGVGAAAGMLIGVIVAIRLYPQDGRGLRAFGRHAPYGASFALLAGSFLMIGFPFDFLWHELFGQDVTLWSPSHIELIGGGALSVLGFAMLAAEARARPDWRPTAAGKFLMACPVVAAPTVISVFAAEFDFGIPQFQILYLPVLIAFMTTAGFVFARILLGPTGALRALAIWLVLRGAVYLVVEGLDMSTPHFYPYVLEAVAVEAAFMLAGRRPLRAALLAAGAIGTLGCLSTFWFSRVWGYNDLPWDLLPQALPLATLAALAAATLATGVARAMAPDRVVHGGPQRHALALAGVAAVAALAIPLPRGGDPGYVADITLTPAVSGESVWVSARFADPALVEGADWFDVFAWQGGGKLNEPMRRVASDTWRSPVPVPIGGEWKSLLRIADGSAMRGAPIRMPADPFVDARAIPAADRPAFRFRREQQYMMREYRGGMRSLILPGTLLHLAVWIAFLVLAGMVLRRMYDAARHQGAGAS